MKEKWFTLAEILGVIIPNIINRISAGSDEAKNIENSTFKIDKVAPTCNITVESRILGNNDWYTSNVRLDLNYSDNADGNVSCEDKFDYIIYYV